MLHKDYTTQLLGIANVSVDKIEKKDDATYIFLSTEKAQQICPSCANTVLHIHDYRMQKIKDLSFHGKPCYLILRKRRYVCKHCGKRFSEKYAFLPRYCHFTQRVYLSILNSMSKTMSCKNIAAVHNVSPATVMRIFALCAYPTRPQLPEVLGIDEFKGNTGGEKYNCILTDIARREVVNILPSRKKEQMREYFRRYSRAEREKVKVFVCDMWKDYRDISLLFPNAVLVTDKYHWVRQVIWAVEKVRKRVQKQFPKNKRLHFKRNKYILLAYQEKLEVEDGLVLKYMLNQNTDLYHAWQLKEMFYAFKDSTTYAEAAKRLKEFLLAAEQTEITFESSFYIK